MIFISWDVLYLEFKYRMILTRLAGPKWRLFYKMAALISKIVIIFISENTHCHLGMFYDMFKKFMKLQYAQHALFEKETVCS